MKNYLLIPLAQANAICINLCMDLLICLWPGNWSDGLEKVNTAILNDKASQLHA